MAELIGGFTFSLLSPFYTKEATAKGLTVSETGLVSVSSTPGNPYGSRRLSTVDLLIKTGCFVVKKNIVSEIVSTRRSTVQIRKLCRSFPFLKNSLPVQ
jgi:hypothetical protein